LGPELATEPMWQTQPNFSKGFQSEDRWLAEP
jgi:hypothetical protein